MQEVDVYVNRQRAGRLARAQQRHGFTYVLDAPEALSLTMPLRVESYVYEQGLHPLFQMNLPEGYLRQAIERFAAKQFGSDDLTYLTLLGNHQIGRLRYTVADKNLPPDTLAAPPLNDLLHSDDANLFHQLFERYAMYSGVAGVQPKVLMELRNDTNTALVDKATLPLKKYIVKSWGPEFPQLACNEFLCMTLARNAGLNVPNIHLSDNGQLLICERFDVDFQDQSLGFEDFCVLQARSTQQKYDSSIESCANTVRQYVSPHRRQQALEDFFKLTVLNVKIQNGDAHLKNFGIVYKDLPDFHEGDQPAVQRDLAPVYDIVSTTPYIAGDSMALTLTGSKRWPKRKVLEKFAMAHCNLPKKKIQQVFDEIDAACEQTYGLLESLSNSHPEFEPIGEKIGKIMNKAIL